MLLTAAITPCVSDRLIAAKPKLRAPAAQRLNASPLILHNPRTPAASGAAALIRYSVATATTAQ